MAVTTKFVFERDVGLKGSLWRVFEVIAQVVGNTTKANRSPKIDGKARILGSIFREETREGRLRIEGCEALSQGMQAHVFSKLLKENFHENARRRRSFLLSDHDVLHDTPW